MPPGAEPRGVSRSQGRGGGRGRGAGRGRSRGRGRGRGGRSAGLGTNLPSALAPRNEGNQRKDDRRGKRNGKDATSYAFEDDSRGVGDRRKYDEEAGYSDDSGNPENSEFEDEEVDEDEAFDSADEDRYGELLETIEERRDHGGCEGKGKGKGKGNSRKKGPVGSDSEADDDYDEDEDDDGEGGMTVMDMFEANEAAATQADAKDPSVGVAKGKKSAQGKGAAKAKKQLIKGEKQAASRDDGPEHGHRQSREQQANLMEEESEADFSDDDGGDNDLDERHEQLLGFVGSLRDEQAAAECAAEQRRTAQLLPEGEFNATPSAALGATTDDGVSKSGGVTMETLMASLQGTKAFATVRRQVNALTGEQGAPSAPTSKMAELRAERETTYASSRKDMGKWVAPVQALRRAETIDFTPKVKSNISNASLASSHRASTAMEKEVEMLLNAGGTSEKGLMEKEAKELEAKELTEEEVKERYATLAKMRAYALYEERKRHQMNKIKSKTYRKMKKRERNRMAEAELEGNGEAEQATARRRAEERMTLRHKNTSRWVKHALRSKGGAATEGRKAISEQLRLGDELRAKMDSVGNKESDNEGSSSEDESQQGRAKKPALSQADREELQRIGDEGDEDIVSGKANSLFKMPFMQKAMEKRKERAKEQAAAMLRELEEAGAEAEAELQGVGEPENLDSSDEEGAPAGGRTGGAKGKKKHATKSRKSVLAGDSGGDCSNGKSSATRAAAAAAAAADVAKALPDGTLQSSAVSMDARVRSSVQSPITIDLGPGAGGGHSAGTSKGGDARHSAPQSFSSAAEEMNASGRQETHSLNVPEEGARVQELEAETSLNKKSRNVRLSKKEVQGTAVPGAKGGGSKIRRKASAVETPRGDDDEGQDEVEEEDGENPWLASASNRRRASTASRADKAEILLDVRNAAASALSAFSGSTPEDDGEGGMKDKEHSKTRKRENGDSAKDAQGSSKQKKQQERESQDDEKKGKSNAEQEGISEKAGKRPRNEEGVKKRDKVAKKLKGTNKDGNSKGRGGAPTKKANQASDGAKSNAPGGTLTGLSNKELVRRAFAAPDFEAEFEAGKEDEITVEVTKGREKLPQNLDGWGSWAGMGAPKPRGPSKRQREAKVAQANKEEHMRRARRDDRLPKVIINEKRQKRSSKYMVTDVPYPFTSREQYDRSLRQPVGNEWNTSQSVRDMTRPAIIVPHGTSVAPMELKKSNSAGATEEAKMLSRRGGSRDGHGTHTGKLGGRRVAGKSGRRNG